MTQAMYLPRSLASLATLAARDATRYALTGVRIQEYADGRFRAEATDGKILGIVRGTSEDQQFTPLGVVSGATEGLVPADAWKEAFQETERLARKMKKQGQNAETLRLGLVLGEKGFTFCLPSCYKMDGDLVEGRFPATDDVLSKQRPVISIDVNAEFLIRLLQCARQFSTDDDDRVTLHLYTKNMPLGVTAQDGNGTFFDGLVMPLSRR